MNEYTQARCRAAQNAALLLCLKEQPAIPQNSAHNTNDGNNALSLSRETQLVEHFAFISSTKDDPNGVTAVCMEEDQDRAGMTFRVATNTGCLSEIVQKLQAVAGTMMRAATRGMFEKIVTQTLRSYSEQTSRKTRPTSCYLSRSQ